MSKKLRKEIIGSKVYDPILNRNFVIEEGKEDIYYKLGLDVFVRPSKPKLQKNVKNRKKRSKRVDSDSNGTNDNNES